MAGKIYVIPNNGTPKYIFDPSTNSWSRGPAPSYSDAAHGSCVMLDDYVMIATPNGAYSGQMTVPFYQVSTSKWERGVSYATSDRRWFSVACIDTDLYLAGGYTQFTDTKIRGTILRYHAEVPAGWTLLSGKMTDERYGAAAASLNGEIVVLGGEDFNKYFKTVEAYNPASDTWRSLPAMIQPRTSFAAVVLNGKIYAIGGIGGSGVLSQVERYTPR